MIDYDRGSWYGIHLLFRMRGSLLPRCVPAALLGACIAGGVELAEAYYDFDLDLGDKYSMQLFGLVFGYLSIARLNISYNRYWEGATELHVLHSKWADAASQTLAFDRIDDAREDISDDFCMHIVRLFSQFSAVATAMLHLTPAEQQAMWNHLEQRLDRASTPPKTPGPGEAAVDRLQLTEIIDSEELAYLRAAPCPVLCTEHRLSRAISTRFRSRGWRAPAPVVSRIFQEMSNGMVAYHAARKITKVAMPFAYVQFNALLLLLFTCLAPFAIGAFTTNAAFSVATSAITCAGFAAMFLVANELEDPFGSDHNDLPVVEEHRAFIVQMRSLLRWLPADTFGVEGVTAAGMRRASGRRELVMDTSWMKVAGAMRDGTLRASIIAAGTPGPDADDAEAATESSIPLGHRGDNLAVRPSSKCVTFGTTFGDSVETEDVAAEPPSSSPVGSRSASPPRQKKRPPGRKGASSVSDADAFGPGGLGA